MKWLAIFLLLTNVLYLGWEVDREAEIIIRNSPSAVSIPADAMKLQLISETDQQLEQRVRQVMDVSPVITTPGEEEMTNDALVAELPDILLEGTDEISVDMECYRYGPLPDETIVSGLRDWFMSRDIQSVIHYTEDNGSQLFWIYLAPQQSREGALALIEEIQRSGIRDFRLIGRGDLENAISLGLYSSRQAVNNRLRELNEKGYVPVIVPYSDVTRIYWLDVKLANSSLLKDSLLNGAPAKYDFEPLNCNDISTI